MTKGFEIMNAQIKEMITGVFNVYQADVMTKITHESHHRRHAPSTNNSVRLCYFPWLTCPPIFTRTLAIA